MKRIAWGFLLSFLAGCMGFTAWNTQRGVSPWQHHLENTLALPSADAWLGYDAFGRPLVQLLAASALQSFWIALAVVVMSLAISFTLCALMTALPKYFQTLSVRMLEWFLAFPTLLLALALAAWLGSSPATLVLSLAVGTIPSVVRLFYLKSQEILSEPYIAASRGLGGSSTWIAKHHLLRSMGPIVALCVPGLLAHAIMAESTLSFIGVGVGAGYESWGTLLAQAKDYLIEAPHIAWATGTPLVATLMALQFLTEARLNR